MPEPLAHSYAVLSPQGDAILVADPSIAGDAIAAALRARGFTVIEVGPDLLAARALAEAPRALIVDVDQQGAVEAVERARELCAMAPPAIFCLGDPLRAAELGVTRAEGRVFLRPIDIGAVVAAVTAVTGPRTRGEASPPTMAQQRRPTYPPPRVSDSDAPPPPSELPSMADPLEVAGLLPSLEDAMSPSRILPNELSPELDRILTAAEQRVITQHRPSSIPSPADEMDLLLPPDLLAALDEPLDPEEDSGTGSGSGSGGGATHAPRVNTGASGSRVISAIADTADVTGRRTSTHEQTDARLPSSVVMPQAMDSRFDPRSFAITPHAGMPIVPSIDPRLGQSPPTPTSGDPRWGQSPPAPPSPEPRWGQSHQTSTTPADRRNSSTLPPSPSDGEIEQEAPLQDLPSAILPQVVVQVGRTGSAPVIRDAATLARLNAPGPDTPQSKISTAPTLPLFPPPAAPDAEIEPPRATAATQEKTSPGRSSPPAGPQQVIIEGDAITALARAVATRASGALAMGREPAVRRVVLHDGDIVTAGSTAPEETLLAFLTARGDLPREVAARLGGRLPAFGRHAGAALIAHGHLGQDDLWPVLRAHAEWIIGRALTSESGVAEIEPEPAGRLRAEPNVFGGATGAEVLVEEVRRVISPDEALRRLGGASARLADGARRALLSECALRREEEALVRGAAGRSIGEVVKGAEPELANVLYALVALGVLDALAPAAPAEEEPSASVDPLDAEAIRQRVRARTALVEDSDYFALLGVPRSATGYEVRRAYLDLRRSFEPSRVLTGATADLAPQVRLIIEVLDEAYDILRDPHRRERYRKAIDAGPP